jgi:hypothetical protein
VLGRSDFPGPHREIRFWAGDVIELGCSLTQSMTATLPPLGGAGSRKRWDTRDAAVVVMGRTVTERGTTRT